MSRLLKVSVQMYHKSENPYFYIYFFNMDISLIIALTCSKTCMCILEICMEGSISQNFDLGLSFCFMLCGRRHFEKKVQKITKVTRFLL